MKIQVTSATSRQQALAQYMGAGYWRIWTAYNRDVTLGTYLELAPDGSSVIVTVEPDGTQRITGPVTQHKIGART